MEIRIDVTTGGEYGWTIGYQCTMPDDTTYSATFPNLHTAFLNCMHFVSLRDYTLIVSTAGWTQAQVNDLSRLVSDYIGLRTSALQSWIDSDGCWHIYY